MDGSYCVHLLSVYAIFYKTRMSPYLPKPVFYVHVLEPVSFCIVKIGKIDGEISIDKSYQVGLCSDIILVLVCENTVNSLKSSDSFSSPPLL